MRLIGHLPNESSARVFGAYLTSADIANLVEAEDGQWAVWVHNEDQIPAGMAALELFRQDPSDPKFRDVEKKAALIEEQRRADNAAAAKRIKTPDAFRRRTFGMPVTLAMMIISIVVTIVGRSEDYRYWIYFSLPHILRGQVWRLISPIFLHFGAIHLLFDMWMLRDLGSFLESHEGVGRFLFMTVVMAIGSNFCQYEMAGPFFGGFSGVLYGYFGYMWIRSRVDPNSGMMVAPQWVSMMLVWFVLCWCSLLGDVANWCHTGGLLIGMAWGALPKIGLDRR